MHLSEERFSPQVLFEVGFNKGEVLVLEPQAKNIKHNHRSSFRKVSEFLDHTVDRANSLVRDIPELSRRE